VRLLQLLLVELQQQQQLELQQTYTYNMAALSPSRSQTNADRIFPRPPRDDFTSKMGSEIKLGWHKSNSACPSIRAYDAQFLGHTSRAPAVSPISTSRQGRDGGDGGYYFGSSSSGQGGYNSSASNGLYDARGGLRDTKFGSGFARKNSSSISNPAADEVRRIKEASEERGEALNRNRAAALVKIDQMNGFNVITGAPKGEGKVDKPVGKRSIQNTLSAEVAANSITILRESQGRFHMPHASGVKHEYRQLVLYKDGCWTPKTSAILQPGKADLPSDGTEDNFSKSRYPMSNPPPGTNRIGLQELREPGKYTPRKQVGNPSAVPELAKRWGSGLDINNKTLKCMW